MIKAKQSSVLIKAGIALLDLGLIAAAYWLANLLRYSTLENVDKFIWLLYFSAPMILLLLLRNGVLTGFRYQRLRDIFRSTIFSFLAAGVATSTFLYLSKTEGYSRLLFSIYFALALALVLAEKVIIKKFFDTQLRRGWMNIRIAMVGFGPRLEKIASDIRARPQLGIDIAIVCDPREEEIETVARKVRESIVDEVYVVYPRGEIYHRQIDSLLYRLELYGLPVKVALNFNELQNYYAQHFCSIGGETGLLLTPYNLDPDQLIMKRAMDLCGALVGLAMLAITLPFIAIVIKLDSRGPVFFSQPRVGKGGREFRIHKFRTMHVDAEERKAELMQHNIHEGPLFKMENDPRITRVGRFLRKYSVDEFPQFWNVLKGEMSLVGTRPPTRDEVNEYEEHHYRRISIKPGITGLWQISGRNDVESFEEVVALDVKYIKSWNAWLDVQIILNTVGLVFHPGSAGGR